MPDTCDLGAFDKVKFPLPENFYDKYEGRIAASEQEMNIFKGMVFPVYRRVQDSRPVFRGREGNGCFFSGKIGGCYY